MFSIYGKYHPLKIGKEIFKNENKNIKINIYLNETEKKMLKEKSSEMKLSQSNFIRKLIDDFKTQKTFAFFTSLI